MYLLISGIIYSLCSAAPLKRYPLGHKSSVERHCVLYLKSYSLLNPLINSERQFSMCVSRVITVHSPVWGPLLSSVPVLLIGIQTVPFYPPSASPQEHIHGKDGMICFLLKSGSHCSDCAGCSEGVRRGRFLHLSLMLAQPWCWAKRQSTINPKVWTSLHNSAVTKQQFVWLYLSVLTYIKVYGIIIIIYTV